MSSRVWFVTGTDTGVGKTVVTAALVAALADQGRSPYVVKPAQTGVAGAEPSDLDEVRRLAGDVPGHEGVRLAAPLAPDTAARLEGATLPTLAAQRAAVLAATDGQEVVVEGAGGVLVRLGDDWDLLGLAQQVAEAGVEVRFVVVVRSGLGTLNHTCLTVNAIRQAGLTVHGLVVGSWPAEPDLAETQNLLDLPRLTGVPVLGRVPANAGALDAARFVAEAPTWLALPG